MPTAKKISTPKQKEETVVNNRLNFLANNNRTDEYGSIAGGLYRLVKKFVQFPEVQIILEMRQKL